MTIIHQKIWDSAVFDAAQGESKGGGSYLADQFSSVSAVGVDSLEPGMFYIGDDDAVYRHYTRKKEDDELVIAPKRLAVPEAQRANSREKRLFLHRMRLLINMRDTAREILALQALYSDDDVAEMGKLPWQEPQERLNAFYDHFAHSFGAINKVEGDDLLTRPNLKKFRKDPYAALVSSIERYDEATKTGCKGPIFTQRVEPYGGKPRPWVTRVRRSLGHVKDKGAETVRAFIDGADVKSFIDSLERDGFLCAGHAPDKGTAICDRMDQEVRQLISIVALKEMGRDDTLKKPLLVLPREDMHHLSRNFMRVYPHARILVAEEDRFWEKGDGSDKALSQHKINKFFKKIKTGEWDAVFLSEKSFKRIKESVPRKWQGSFAVKSEFDCLGTCYDVAEPLGEIGPAKENKLKKNVRQPS